MGDADTGEKIGLRDWVKITMVCPVCLGVGSIDKEDCPRCLGSRSVGYMGNVNGATFWFDRAVTAFSEAKINSLTNKKKAK